MLVLGVLLDACSRSYSTALDEATGRQRVYALSEAEAVAIAHNAILRSFPGRKVEEISGPIKGFFTYTRFMLDTFTQQVVIHPVSGLTSSGAAVDGYTFDVSGSGTSGSGAISNGNFYRALKGDLDSTGKGVDVVSSQPRLVAGVSAPSARGDMVDQLRRLKGLLDDGAITNQDYESKKAELLGRI